VLVEELLELRVAVEALVLHRRSAPRKVASEGGDPVAVALLPAADRPVELSLGDSLRSLDADAPRQLLDRCQREERGERGLATVSPRVRATGPDTRRIDGERPEQPVDVVDDAERGGAGVPVGCRDESLARGRDDRVRLGVEVDRHPGGVTRG
jgi:hypothetical protein